MVGWTGEKQGGNIDIFSPSPKDAELHFISLSRAQLGDPETTDLSLQSALCELGDIGGILAYLESHILLWQLGQVLNQVKTEPMQKCAKNQ